MFIIVINSQIELNKYKRELRDYQIIGERKLFLLFKYNT